MFDFDELETIRTILNAMLIALVLCGIIFLLYSQFRETREEYCKDQLFNEMIQDQ